MFINRHTLILFVFLFSILSCEDTILENLENENSYVQYPFIIEDPDRTRTVDFKIPDTGLTKHLLDGDDASYSKVPNAIDLTVYNNFAGSDDIVSDNVTGRYWTKCTALENYRMDIDNNCEGGNHGLYYWDDARILCEDLNYAGFNDWRLPTASELFSIVNFGYTAPAVDASVFPNTEGTDELLGKYWSGTTSNLFNEDLRWTLNFNSVDGPREIDPLLFLNVSFLSESCYVRCVRNK